MNTLTDKIIIKQKAPKFKGNATKRELTQIENLYAELCKLNTNFERVDIIEKYINLKPTDAHTWDEVLREITQYADEYFHINHSLFYGKDRTDICGVTIPIKNPVIDGIERNTTVNFLFYTTRELNKNLKDELDLQELYNELCRHNSNDDVIKKYINLHPLNTCDQWCRIQVLAELTTFAYHYFEKYSIKDALKVCSIPIFIADSEELNKHIDADFYTTRTLNEKLRNVLIEYAYIL